MARNQPWPPPVYPRRGMDVIRIYLGPRNYREVTLGPTGSDEARAAYTRTLLELEATGRRGLPDPGSVLTVSELASRWLAHARTTRTVGEQSSDRLAWSVVVGLYGREPVTSFGPLALKACRVAWVQRGREGCPLVADFEMRKAAGLLRRSERRPKILSRKYINRLLRYVRLGFSWGVSEELVPESVAAALERVKALRRKKTIAPERPKVRPAKVEVVEATLLHMPAIAREMPRVQLLTGMRPGEVCALRPCDIDRQWKTVGGVTVWLYRLDEHKNDWRGHIRWVPIGPKAQAILGPLLEGRDPQAYVFSPAEVTERWLREHGRSPRRGRKRLPGARYTNASYGRCITKACKRAGVKRWTPNQLRHTVATEVETHFGREDARCVLGHATPQTTAIYAEWVDRAGIVIAQFG